MTVEFIQKRIEGKQKELAKLEKKMERIRKAEASNWENNPYYYRERDIQITEKEILQAKKALEDYKEALVKENEKAASRDIEVILDFLANWKNRVRESYENALPRYKADREAWFKVSSAYTEWFNYERRNIKDKEELIRVNEEKDKEYREARNKFNSTWRWLTPYLENLALNYEKLNKDLDKEANAKYDFIIERTNEITGTITDATNLHIGMKGDLNGYIIGERGKAKVETIGAGGYNIQCYHFRTLINKMK